METVGTQTSWSWLQDIAELERFAKRHGSKTNLSFQWAQANQNTSENQIASPSETGNQPKSVRFSTTPPIATDNSASHSVTLPPISKSSTDSNCVAQALNSSAVSESSSSSHDTGRDISLPSISATNHAASDRSSDKVHLLPTLDSDKSGENSNQLSIFRKLEQTVCSEAEEDSDRSDSSEASSSDQEDEDESGDSTKESAKQPKFPDLQGLTELSLPTILHYVRESESLVSKYFSLQNKEEVRRRTEDAKHGSCNTDIENQLQRKTENVEKEEESMRFEEVKTEREGSTRIEEESLKAEEASMLTCHFCGKSLPRRTMLSDSLDIDKINEEDYFCCVEYKEFTIHVAVCMRQTIEKLRTDPPQKIPIISHAKIPDKTLMEERALAILRRKQKWEEIRRRKRLQAETRRMAKGTKTITFTLESPGEVEQTWAVRPNSSDGNRQPQARKKKKAAKRKKTVEKISIFPPETLERLKSNASFPREFERRLYSDGTPCCTIFPDRTGFCNYPSGKKAIVMFTLYDGVLAYLVYEDSEFPELLAYADELGRTCCYGNSGNIQFLSIPSLMVQFDSASNTRRKIKSSDVEGVSPPQFQPISLPLGKHITLKSYNEKTSIATTFPHNHLKFNMISQLQLGETPSYSPALVSTQQALEGFLTATKSRITELFYVLQNISQIHKLQQLESVYGSPMSRGARILNPSRKEVDRKRTRSTGAIKVKKTGHEKHPKAMTLNLV